MGGSAARRGADTPRDSTALCAPRPAAPARLNISTARGVGSSSCSATQPRGRKTTRPVTLRPRALPMSFGKDGKHLLQPWHGLLGARPTRRRIFTSQQASSPSGVDSQARRPGSQKTNCRRLRRPRRSTRRPAADAAEYATCSLPALTLARHSRQRDFPLAHPQHISTVRPAARI